MHFLSIYECKKMYEIKLRKYQKTKTTETFKELEESFERYQKIWQVQNNPNSFEIINYRTVKIIDGVAYDRYGNVMRECY